MMGVTAKSLVETIISYFARLSVEVDLQLEASKDQTKPNGTASCETIDSRISQLVVIILNAAMESRCVDTYS